MQRVGIISILYKLIGYFLGFLTRTAKNDTINLRIKINDTFQCQIFIFCVYYISHMINVLASFILGSDGNLLCLMQISLRNTGNFRTHRRREHQSIPVLRYIFKNCIDTIREAHIQHLIRFIHYHVADCSQLSHLAFHQVNQAAGSSYDNMHSPLQATNLAIYGRTSIHRKNL